MTRRPDWRRDNNAGVRAASRADHAYRNVTTTERALRRAEQSKYRSIAATHAITSEFARSLTQQAFDITPRQAAVLQKIDAKVGRVPK